MGYLGFYCLVYFYEGFHNMIIITAAIAILIESLLGT